MMRAVRRGVSFQRELRVSSSSSSSSSSRRHNFRKLSTAASAEKEKLVRASQTDADWGGRCRVTRGVWSR